MYEPTDLNDNSDCDDSNDPQSCISYYRRLESGQSTFGRPELKTYDAQVNYQIPQDGFVVCINPAATGTGEFQYLGNEVTTRSVSWIFTPYSLTIEPTQIFPTIKISLVWDLQPNASPANYTDIYATVPGIPPFQVFQHMNVNNRQRFIILKTWLYPSPLFGGLNAETGSLAIDMPTVYPNGATIGFTPVTGALLLTMCQSGNDLFNLTGMFRTRYYDN